MKMYIVTFVFYLLAALISSVPRAHSAQERTNPVQLAGDGLHGFDFLLGEWLVEHRRLQPDRNEWVEFDGTCSHRNLMDGLFKMDEYVLNAPAGTYRAVAMRAYDRKTGEWAIWWLDERYPSGPLDPPVTGRFKNGIGTFYSDFMDKGKSMRVRFIWSNITPTSARWEQAISADQGKTWKTNWIMNFRRLS